MLALEHSRRQHFDQAYDLEHSIQGPFPGLTMDMYESTETLSNFHPMPYSFFENPSMFATAPMQAIKQEMHHFQELPPALVSSSGSAHSIPSASSSTVGSPYTGPSHAIMMQDGYDHSAASFGLGVMPTIVNPEVFSQDILGNAIDAELSLSGHEKLPDSFVGECADLSFSQPRSTAVAPPKTQYMQPLSSSPPTRCLPLASSPQALSIDTFSNRPPSSVSSAPSTLVFSPATEQKRPAPTFKSPTTPASACSRQSLLVSPVNSRRLPTPSRAQTNPGLHTPMAPHRFANVVPQQHRVKPFQSHFFAQSSGNFMPPLETSCSSLPSAVSRFSFCLSSFIFESKAACECHNKLTKDLYRSGLDSCSPTVWRHSLS
jgi:hypothetical protein